MDSPARTDAPTPAEVRQATRDIEVYVESTTALAASANGGGPLGFDPMIQFPAAAMGVLRAASTPEVWDAWYERTCALPAIAQPNSMKTVSATMSPAPVLADSRSRRRAQVAVNASKREPPAFAAVTTPAFVPQSAPPAPAVAAAVHPQMQTNYFDRRPQPRFFLPPAAPAVVVHPHAGPQQQANYLDRRPQPRFSDPEAPLTLTINGLVHQVVNADWGLYDRVTVKHSGTKQGCFSDCDACHHSLIAASFNLVDIHRILADPTSQYTILPFPKVMLLQLKFGHFRMPDRHGYKYTVRHTPSMVLRLAPQPPARGPGIAKATTPFQQPPPPPQQPQQDNAKASGGGGGGGGRARMSKG